MSAVLRSEIPWWVWDSLDDRTPDLTTWVPGGLGSGKSYGTALWHVQRCHDNWRSKYSWMIAPTHAKVNSITIPALVEVLYNHFGMSEPKDFTVHSGAPARVYLKRFDQTIFGHSANKWRLLVGENISHWSATEVGYYQSRDWYDKCQMRTRCPKAFIRQGMGEGTPEGTDNWFAELADIEEGFHPETITKRITVHTADNKHLPDGYVEKIKRQLQHDKGKLESYLYGRFVPFTRGTAYWEFFHSRNTVLDVAPSRQLPVLMCWDFNLSPLAWGAVQRQPHETNFGYRFHRFVQLAEASGKSRGIMDACVEFMVQFPPHEWRDVPIHVYGDCSGYFGSHLTPSDSYDQILQYLREKYSNVQILADKSAPRIQARLERVNALLANEEFVIAAWLKNSIKSRSTTALKNGMWKIEKPTGEDWTHFSEAVDYMLFQETKDLDLSRSAPPKIYGLNL